MNPVRQQFICTVLQRAEEVDYWSLYRTLSEPMDELQGGAPVEAVTSQNFPEAASAVFMAVGDELTLKSVRRTRDPYTAHDLTALSAGVTKERNVWVSQFHN